MHACMRVYIYVYVRATVYVYVLPRMIIQVIICMLSNSRFEPPVTKGQSVHTVKT